MNKFRAFAVSALLATTVATGAAASFAPASGAQAGGPMTQKIYCCEG